MRRWILLLFFLSIELGQSGELKPSGARSAFTDRDFKELVQSGKTGLIYAWSPHMHLSLRGYQEAKKAAVNLKVELIPVLDPFADRQFAEQEARRVGMDKGGLRRIEAAELLSRNITLHYPGILLFSRGRISEAIMPGFKSAETYERFILRELR